MWFIIQAQVCIVHPLSNPKLRQWELILSVWPEAWIFQPRPVVDLIFHLGINVALYHHVRDPATPQHGHAIPLRHWNSMARRRGVWHGITIKSGSVCTLRDIEIILLPRFPHHLSILALLIWLITPILRNNCKTSLSTTRTLCFQRKKTMRSFYTNQKLLHNRSITLPL